MRRVLIYLSVPSLVLGVLSAVGSPGAAQPSADPATVAADRLEADSQGRVTVRREAGRATFIGTPAGRPVDHPGVRPSTAVDDAARAHLDRYGAALAGKGSGPSLVQRGDAVRTAAGTHVVRFQQEVGGLPVVGAEVVVTLAPDRDLVSVLSTASASTPSPAARVDEATAAATARAAVLKHGGTGDVSVEQLGRWVLDPAVIGGRPGPARSAWRFDVRRGVDTRRTVLVDDVTGSVLMDLSTINHVDRVVCDNSDVPVASESTCTSGFARTEGGLPSRVQDVNQAYDYSGAVSTFYSATGGLDLTELLGVDVGGDKKLASTVRFCYVSSGCPFANAFWNGIQMYYGTGYAAADDVVGHEITHGVIDRFSELFYWGQSGAINESMADIMGEIVDHRTAGPGDSPASWSLGEDLPCCAPSGIRNLKDPTLFDDPDSTQSPLWVNDADSGYFDNGGVHFNSGVGNKTAYLISQGGSFRGQTVVGIDAGDPQLTRTAKLYLLAIQSLSSGSDYADLADVLDQSCQTLRGSAGFTAAHCDNVHKAGLATALRTTPSNAAQPADAPATCPAGAVKRVLFDSEVGAAENKFDDGLRWVRGEDPGWGSNAHSGVDAWSNAGFGSVSSDSLTLATPIAVPAGRATFLHFHQWRLLEYGPGSGENYDGGTVEIDDTSTAEGPVDAGDLPWVNGPVNVLASAYGNPAGGRKSFGRDSFGYVASRLDLSTFAGRSVVPQFTINNDGSVNYLPWYLDDITIYTCDPLVVAGTVTASGTPRVGKTLTAAVSGWRPSGVTFAYQWLRNGAAVPGAVSRTLKLRNADKGKRISVRVTGTKAGHVTAVKTSAATAKVKPKKKRRR